jgi:hypothetical protein
VSTARCSPETGRARPWGANPFLLCQLGRRGIFGLNHERYAERMRAEFAAEREAMAAARAAAAPTFGTTGSFGR